MTAAGIRDIFVRGLKVRSPVVDLGILVPWVAMFLFFVGSAAGSDLSMNHVTVDDACPSNPHSKSAGDINGDGHVDLVIASSGGGPLVWYKYPGWTKCTIAASGRWSTDAEVGDLDGDGDQDVLVSDWYTNNRIEWYQNPGPAGNPATSPWALRVIGSPRAHDIELGDLDRDGDLDIVTRQQGGAGNKLEVWIHGTGNSWTHRALDCAAGEGLHLADLDKDGDPDIVLGGTWYETPANPVSGTFTARAYTTTYTYTQNAIATGDVNGDGRVDILLTPAEAAGTFYRTSWFRAPLDPRSGGWAESIIENNIEAVTHSLASADMDGDGDLDVVTAEMHQGVNPDEVRVYLNETGIGTSWSKHVVATSGSHSIRVVDVGNDGAQDIYGANWSGTTSVDLWLGTPLTVAIELLQFDLLQEQQDVVVSWMTGSEEDVSGFHVLRSEVSDPGLAERLTTQILTGGREAYSFRDSGVEEGVHWYWLEEVSRTGEVRLHGPRSITVLAPQSIAFLAQNRPNPFSQSTEIAFTLQESAAISLEVFDLSGRLVRRLIQDETLPTGEHSVSWDGREEGGKPVPPSMYFYRLTTPGEVQTKKLLYLR